MNRITPHAGAGPIVVPVPEPFNYAAALAYLSRSSDEALYAVEGNSLVKLFARGGEEILVRVDYAEDGSGTAAVPRLVATFPMGDAPSPAMREHIGAYMLEWFDLDRDLEPFYVLTESSDLLREAGRTFRGLRMIGIPDLFEAVCWAIIGQQINLAFAYTLKKRFTETFGRSVSWNGREYWAFPEPAVVASLEPADIMALQMTGRKSEYLIGAARLVADGTLDKPSLLEAGWEGAESKLVAIRGIGLWTAHYVMMRCLRMPEALPAADVGLLNAIKAAGGMERRPTADEARELARPWKGWEAYATFYLWRTLY
ncbi:DNA-3-methyladenine glycosylase [Paenibacillus sp. P22]|uniref:DNA-3-methyladenine glycosylase 2 n=1 Tax=Paenibacillus sp. P22 TaxID=483908 RepID=UPI000404A59B|nr:DNA-3-methyladenine glycosylase [Paenibacillus sp. P22]CDN42996.1 DNA-3-methyladenine glycosylase [Paenibacillus sp. P22]